MEIQVFTKCCIKSYSDCAEQSKLFIIVHTDLYTFTENTKLVIAENNML